jgi:hypothetical protein
MMIEQRSQRSERVDNELQKPVSKERPVLHVTFRPSDS